MKKVVVLLLVVTVFLSGCAKTRSDVTPEQIVAAYEDAGYSVSFKMYDEKLDYGQIGYIQADDPDGSYIYFYIFEAEADAAAYKKQFYHPAMMGLFSAIYAQPSWPRWEVHGSIVAEYDDPEFYEVFEKLLRE